MELTSEEKSILVQTARKSIESIIDKKKIELHIDPTKYPILTTKSGVFVTLKINEQLRGCIGYITTDEPLYKTIQDAATNAAFRDPRFPPLQKSEYDEINLEISILSEPFPMKSYDEIVLGEHGLILEENGRRGLLLPQVPIEHEMNKEEYLEAICRKTGIPNNEWKKKKLDMYLFTATVFDEKEVEYKDGSN